MDSRGTAERPPRRVVVSKVESWVIEPQFLALFLTHGRRGERLLLTGRLVWSRMRCGHEHSPINPVGVDKPCGCGSLMSRVDLLY